ncbi:MAG: ABC-F family ATP-binding cassette domain-containing protein [Firmicutes bacterium]|nr:ABC-F family ATP-binding cassette domain-containing protein [Bacillota bacterium]
MILSLTHIAKSYGAAEILADVTFTLEEREKAAMVGVNGAGKTTVFRIITGELEPDSGEISAAKESRAGYLPQTAEFESGGTVYSELLRVFDRVIAMEGDLREMERRMAGLRDAALAEHMERYSALTHRFEQAKGYEYESRVRGVAKGLGFGEDEWGQSVALLSGGQKTRVALGRLLLAEPDLLLLDEPTNHLDISSVEWLEDYLRAYPGAILIVSHDRYFLDRVTTKTVEIENKRSTVYMGGYTFYARHKEIDRELRMKQYLDQQKEIRRQEEIIRTYRSFNREKSVKAADSREKRLARLERLERPESLPDRMRLMLKPRVESGGDVLFADSVSKSFGDFTLFRDVSFAVKRGEKVALIGPNGVGKTTLFRILLNRMSYGGSVKWGVNVKTGYYDQEHELAASDLPLMDDIRESYPRLSNGEIRNVLAAFVFTGDDVFKTVNSLSGGEKGRVALAKIMLAGANTLLLDEPTNHLDMYSKEILEEALRNFPGTVLYISHDRYFINNTADRVLEMSAEGVTAYLGNYDDYLAKKAENYGDAAGPEKSAYMSRNKSDWLKKKEDADAERRGKSRAEKLRREIGRVEGEIARIDALLMDGETGSDHEAAARLYGEKTGLEERLLELYAEGEEMARAK